MIRCVFIIAVLIGLCSLSSFSQIKHLRVETYYISNADDATDTLGGHLEEGSTTYRIFIELLPDSKLLSIYGDANHPLVFTSTAPFFNHKEEGITFGKDLSRNRFEIGTVPLDSYITLGQCSKSFAQGAYFGIPKEEDLDGSAIGGENNDGGSEAVASGLLINEDAQMGLPLTTADGLTVMSQLPGSWIEIGFIDLSSGKDTTIFGSVAPKYNFNRKDVILKNSGNKGGDLQQNEILVAQLTTKGEITFEINVVVEINIGGTLKTVRYVAQNESLSENEIFESLLSYPYSCGCKDPAYLEANPSFACEDNSKCLTLAVLGCMDSLACNYDPAANYNIQDICCYVGYCHDFDLSVACPNLEPREDFNEDYVKISPNPAYDELELAIGFVFMADIHWAIFDLAGKPVAQGILQGQDKFIPIHTLAGGYYALQLTANDKMIISSFVKI
jgi:hypothetical protein